MHSDGVTFRAAQKCKLSKLFVLGGGDLFWGAYVRMREQVPTSGPVFHAM